MEIRSRNTGFKRFFNMPNSLVCLFLMGTLIVSAFQIFGSNNAQATNSITITARVGAPPPSQAVIIASPQDGQQLAGRHNLFTGTCQPNTYISVLSNGTIRGGTICDKNGSFSIAADLDTGSNEITARTNDGIDQAGPLSSKVNVFVSEVLAGGGLGISVDKSYQRIGQDDNLSWKVKLEGSASLYAVSVDWGDGKNDLLPTKEKYIVLSHKYDKSGARAIKVIATDDQANSSEINLVASVSSLDTLGGRSLTRAADNLSKTTLYITVMLMVASFMVGSYYKGGKKYVWIEKDPTENT